MKAGADVFLAKDERTGSDSFFTKLAATLVNPPRKPNEPILPAVTEVEKSVRDIVS